jgi:hypothetical protein
MLWLAAFGVAALMSGCVKMEEEFTIKPDGSGSISLKYSIAEQSISQIHAMRMLTTELASVQPGTATVAPAGFDRYLFDPVDGDLRALLRTYEPYGVTVEKVEVRTRNARREVEIKAKFKDLAQLSKTEIFRQYGFRLSRNQNMQYELFRAAVTNDPEAAAVFSDPDSVRQVTPLLSGFSVSLNVRVPGKIIRSSAPQRTVTPYSATWVFDFDREPRAFLDLQRQVFSVTFEAGNVRLPEIR